MIEGPMAFRRLLLTAIVTTVAAASQTAPSRALRGADGLARAYDVILDARFNTLDAELQRACGPAPPEACEVLAATALWWRIPARSREPRAGR
jgi:hypothetical protein